MQTIHEEYVKIISERYGANEHGTYEQRGDYSWVLFAPKQYLIEASMLSFIKKHNTATLKEVCEYLDNICPEGLPPTMTEQEIAEALGYD